MTDTFFDIYVKSTYILDYTYTHVFLKPLYYLIRPCIHWVMKQKLLDAIFAIDSMEELIFEFVSFMDKTKRLVPNKTTGIPELYDDPKRPNKFVYMLAKDVMVENNTVIVTQLSSRDDSMCIRIDLNINTSPCVTKLVCTFGKDVQTHLSVENASILMKHKKDIIEMLKEEITDHVWYVYTHILDKLMYNTTGE